MLEMGMIVSPKPRCQHVIMSANWDACMCTLFLPGSMALMPDNLYNPFAIDIPPDPDIPTFPAMPSVPPPSSPLAPYNPPLNDAPECPFTANCGKKPGVNEYEDCVGYDSWGFSEVRRGKYSPASRFFNSLNCFYIMKPYDRFKVPKKIEAFWYLSKKRGDVQTFYESESLTLECKGKGGYTNPWKVFCEDMVWKLKVECSTPWSKFWRGDCEKAPPPKGFTASSQLGEFCPIDCGFVEHKLEWPYPTPPPAAPAPAAKMLTQLVAHDIRK